MEEIFKAAYEMWQARGGNWLLLLPLIPMVLVQLYKTDTAQGLLAQYYPKALFANLSKPKQMLLSFFVGATPVFATYAFMVPWAQALMLAGGAGLAAVFGFKGLKAVSSTETVTSAAALVLPKMMVKPMSTLIPYDIEKVMQKKAKVL